MLQGKVQPYVPENEANEADDGSSVKADMFSARDSDDDAESSHLLEILKPKNFIDKWQALANEREKNKKPVRPRFDVNKPNQELIDAMLVERKRRNDHEAYLKELAERRLEDSEDEEDY